MTYLTIKRGIPRQKLLRFATLHRNILDLCNEYGVQIITPAYEGDPKDAKVVHKDQRYAAPAVPDHGGQA